MIYVVICLIAVIIIIAPIKIKSHSYFSINDKMLAQNIVAIGANFSFNLKLDNNKLVFITRKKSKNLLTIAMPQKEGASKKVEKHNKKKNKIVFKPQFLQPIIIDKFKIFGELGLGDCMRTVLSISSIIVIVGTVKSALHAKNANFTTNIIPNLTAPVCDLNIMVDIKINIFIIFYVTTRILISSFSKTIKTYMRR